MPEAALDNWQPVWNAQVSISTPVCVNFELRPGAGNIHICWFNFDALAQGNAYKPTKEPINYRGPGGDRTHDLQTEATLPVVQHVRFTPLKLRQKRNSNDMPEAALDNWQPVWNAQVSISTLVYVNFELRPGAGDIHICCFNFDALAQGNAYKPTKEHTYINTCLFLLISMLWHRQAIFESKGDKLSSSVCWMQDSNPRSQTPIRQQTECLLTNRLSYRGSS